MLKLKEKAPLWWPEHPPIYDIAKSYLENLEEGPFFEGPLPQRELPPEEEWIDFLGHQIASPLGVPAGPLLNARWTTMAAQLGFDLVTYKTIRSRPKEAHSLPNMVYVDAKGMLTPDRYQEALPQTDTPPLDVGLLAATNSFGIPSMGRDYLIEDIARAKQGLAKGQALIVSVVGTPRPGEDFANDFALAAKIALDGGATLIEANLSCPNVNSCEGSIFTDPTSVETICRKVKKEIGSIPLIIKVGVFPDQPLLREVMVTAARAGVEAICGINTISMKIVNSNGSAALGESRLKAGVCGGPIHQAALTFVNQASKINAQEKLGMTIMATGGVTLPEHFDNFLEAGAEIAMTAVGMMWDPYLATRYHRRKQDG